jgi:hypothetical protein
VIRLEHQPGMTLPWAATATAPGSQQPYAFVHAADPAGAALQLAEQLEDLLDRCADALEQTVREEQSR